METNDDIEVMTTTTNVVLEELTNEKTGEEFARDYFKAGFLFSVTSKLFYARRKANLTQEQVAEKLGKKQSVIARWEADMEGRMSFSNYVEIALALGMVPRIELVPLEQAKAEHIKKLRQEQSLRRLTQMSQEMGLYDDEIALVQAMEGGSDDVAVEVEETQA